MRIFNVHTILMVLAFAGTIFVGCHKHDHHPSTPTTAQSHKWDTIAGHYKVFDTVGGYLYDMDLVHIHNDTTGRDSLRFENFDGQFVFTTQQEEPANFPMLVTIGIHDTLYDSINNRWKIISGIYPSFNSFNNDTIPIRFQITNINYWMEDLTPYYACDCKQIAVKQH